MKWQMVLVGGCLWTFVIIVQTLYPIIPISLFNLTAWIGIILLCFLSDFNDIKYSELYSKYDKLKERYDIQCKLISMR